MKGFFCLLLAVLGLLALQREERIPGREPETGSPPHEPAAVIAKPIPPLAERHAARDAHLRQRLAEAHGPHCKCGRH